MDDASLRSVAGRHDSFTFFHLRLFFILVLAALLSGCGPPGPRALVAGKKLLDHGDYAGAAAKLKTATTLLVTNAAAWNYYGVALQCAGQPVAAAQAYQNALKCDRDLVEAHYNLGCLWLEQGKYPDAATEFTIYTLRRNNSQEGWIKLGTVQLRLRELILAERSFSTAYYLNTNNPEALNGLGLARVADGRPQDAVRFFAATVAAHPDYAPARLNLATVEMQYLHNEAAALENYRAYRALRPRPADWEAVNDLVKNLEQPKPVAAAKAPPPKEPEPAPPAKPRVVEAKPPPSIAPRPQPAPEKREPERTSVAPEPSRPAPPGEAVAVQPEPMKPVEPKASSSQNVVSPESSQPAVSTETTSAGSRPNPAPGFGSSTPAGNYTSNGVTPLASGAVSEPTPPPPAVSTEAKSPQPASPGFPRYSYLAPSKPKAGDRSAAALAFDIAQQAEKNRNFAAAMSAYHQAAALDPSWFEAQYNYAVLAYRQRDYRQALAASETALALQPDSVDARYTFALSLKAAGYATDAVNELRKIVAAHPDEARAQLALGNLYAQQMHDPARARPHYLKWLQLEPQNPQAINIRYWLSQNAP
ncbi:MAG TPA: tetratricopeptide repeat protein [Verrucomicrobiae bacterium]|nr:tetratricopeptide repeat protein [Verrucomicrobiae bacterium]